MSHSNSNTYLSDISRYPPELSTEREQALGLRIQKGDRSARDELVTGNLRFAVRVALEYKATGASIGDLISYANSGLLEAARRFDPNMRVRFISYAVFWIRQDILKNLQSEFRAVRLPQNVTEAHARIAKAKDKMQQELNREPTDAELADAVGVSQRRYANLRRLEMHRCSMDNPIDNKNSDSEGSRGLHDFLPATEVVDNSDNEEVVGEALEFLTPRERDVVESLFGLRSPGGATETLAVIGGRLGVSRERVRQVKNRALDKMRRRAHRTLSGTEYNARTWAQKGGGPMKSPV